MDCSSPTKFSPYKKIHFVKCREAPIVFLLDFTPSSKNICTRYRNFCFVVSLLRWGVISRLAFGYEYDDGAAVNYCYQRKFSKEAVATFIPQARPGTPQTIIFQVE
ncbi:hypothetical protein L3X38_044282 [Prunus dulcis]|uniref:Uncharacterized protein n=1 Tax=Prunus dulcis TaxID=3755 RepID=A0AAD4V056_PRUDU|nr:hypothetical protein L3X38_044282 [Prunus dulcis]